MKSAAIYDDGPMQQERMEWMNEEKPKYSTLNHFTQIERSYQTDSSASKSSNNSNTQPHRTHQNNTKNMFLSTEECRKIKK